MSTAKAPVLEASPEGDRQHTASMMLAKVRPLQSSVRPLRWPLPALVTWLSAWGLWAGLQAAQVAPAWAFLSALIFSGLMAFLLGSTPWRRLMLCAGFPALVMASGLAGEAAAWWWLLAAVPLWWLYPAKAWKDAPFFPTPANALQALPALIGPREKLLDAGCGLGHGLRALRSAWPHAQISGIEYSSSLARLARWRCGTWAQVQQGDMWAVSWAGQDVVYLFQRPESMARAWAKALAELAPGAVLVSLEFDVPGVAPSARLTADDGRPLWVYRVGRAGARSDRSALTAPAVAPVSDSKASARHKSTSTSRSSRR